MSKKKKSKIIQLPQTPEAQIRTRARNLDIGTCYINENWEEVREANILITRKHKQGGTTWGVYLVDLAMKGIKDTFYQFNMSPSDFEGFLNKYTSDGQQIEAEYNLVHNIIYGGEEYGEENGYKAHKDFTSVTQYILEEDSDAIPLMEIEMGINGEPFHFDNLAEDKWDDDEWEEDDEEEDVEFIFEVFTNMLAELPEVTEDQLTDGFPDSLTLEEVLSEWAAEDFKDYLQKNRDNYSYEILNIITLNAWDDLTDFSDEDHYGYQFDRLAERKETNFPELDKLNQEANQLILAKDFGKIPSVYNDKFTFVELFPNRDEIPVISAAEFCRIFCEYYIDNGDLIEATSCGVVIDILYPENKTPTMYKTLKKLLVRQIKEIQSLDKPWIGELE